MEVTKDDYDDVVAQAGKDGIVLIVDLFTDWCGPCKLIYPKLCELAEEMDGKARIVKFNINEYNKEFAKGLGVKVAPTFYVYKGGERVAEMTGAKIEPLRELIEEHA